MNYLLRNNLKPRNKTKRIKFIIAICGFLLFFLVYFKGATDGFIHNIALPFWKFDNYVTGKFSDIFQTVNSKKSLILENRRLNLELNKIKSDLSIQKILQKENDDLKTLFGRGETGKNFVLATVLVRPSFSPFDVIITDIGRDKNIKKGDNVLYGESVVIGKVDEVYERSSRVRLYSSPGEKFFVLIGDSLTQAEAEGLGGGNFSVKLPRDIEVKEGDSAVVPSITTSVFGFVRKIELNPTDSFQKILFKIPVNLSEIKWVLVEV